MGWVWVNFVWDLWGLDFIIFLFICILIIVMVSILEREVEEEMIRTM